MRDASPTFSAVHSLYWSSASQPQLAHQLRSITVALLAVPTQHIFTPYITVSMRILQYFLVLTCRSSPHSQRRLSDLMVGMDVGDIGLGVEGHLEDVLGPELGDVDWYCRLSTSCIVLVLQ